MKWLEVVGTRTAEALAKGFVIATVWVDADIVRVSGIDARVEAHLQSFLAHFVGTDAIALRATEAAVDSQGQPYRLAVGRPVMPGDDDFLECLRDALVYAAANFGGYRAGSLCALREGSPEERIDVGRGY